MTKVEITKDWCTNMANLEDGREIGAGSPDHPLRALHRRHKLPAGECKSCDRETSDFHPSHDASPHCESGKHSHCSCETCF